MYQKRDLDRTLETEAIAFHRVSTTTAIDPVSRHNFVVRLLAEGLAAAF